MTDLSTAAPAQPRWLSLGPASRLLGVDPDTLRRWADEGRVPAWTTPGGHRRFDRRGPRGVRRRPPAARDAPAAGHLGASPERLARVYRRTTRPDRSIRRTDPGTGRRRSRGATAATGRRLVACAGRLPRRGRCRSRHAAFPRGRSRRGRRRAGTPAGRGRHEPDRGRLAASSRPASRSSPSSRPWAGDGRWTRPDWRSCTATPRRCSIACSCGSSSRTSGSAQYGGPRRRPARPDLGPRPAVQRRPVRPVAGAARRVPAHLGDRHALLRHRPPAPRHGRGRWLERAAVPDLVPDRARSGRPAGSDSAPRSCSAGPASATASRCACSWPACSPSSSATARSTRAPGRCPCSTSSPPGSSPWPSPSRRTSPTSVGRCSPPAPSSARRC